MKSFLPLSILLLSPASFVAAQTEYTTSIDFSDSVRLMEGFGASSAWYDDEYYEDLSDDDRADFIKAFFDRDEGLGLSIYRMRIIPSDNGESEEISEEDESFFDWTASKRASSGQLAREIQDAYDPFIMASIWTPPGWMKDTGQESNGGELLPENYDAYARFLSEWVQGMQSEFGVTIDALSVQNEPGRKSWESCKWTNIQLRNFVNNNLIPKLIADGLIPDVDAGEPEGGLKLIINEETTWKDAQLNNLLNYKNIPKHIDIAAAHLYDKTTEGFPTNTFDTARNAGKSVWQTEFYHVNEFGDSDSIDYSTLIARYTHNALETLDVNAYNYWWMANAQVGKEAQALATVVESGGVPFQIFKQGYAFGQYSRFIRPGYFRVNTANPFPATDPEPETPLTSTDIRDQEIAVSAYISPAGNGAVIVAINDSVDPVTLNLTLNGLPSGLSSFDLWRTSETENLSPSGSVSVTAGSLALSLPANSVTTYVGYSQTTSYYTWAAENGLSQDGLGAAAPEYPAGGDGVTNLVKYALGLSLSDAASDKMDVGAWAQSDTTYGTFSAVVPEPAPSDVTYSAIGSEDLE